MTSKLIAECESIKKLRLQGMNGEYSGQAALIFSDMQRQGFVPAEFSQFEILSDGRVNFFTARMWSNQREVFVKFSQGNLEALFHKYGIENKLVTNGMFFISPRCRQIVQIDSCFLYFFDYLAELDGTQSAAMDDIRLRGLAEFNMLNLCTTEKDRLTGIPKHRFKIRPESIRTLQIRGASAEIISQQFKILSKWDCVSLALEKFRLCLCVRDSGRENVTVRNGQAAIIDFGAAHYAPIGFDIWSYIFDAPDVIAQSSSLADTYYRPASKGISTEAVALAGAAAACILVLDVFLSSRSFISERRILELQKTAMDLTEIF